MSCLEEMKIVKIYGNFHIAKLRSPDHRRLLPIVSEQVSRDARLLRPSHLHKQTSLGAGLQYRLYNHKLFIVNIDFH